MRPFTVFYHRKLKNSKFFLENFFISYYKEGLYNWHEKYIKQ